MHQMLYAYKFLQLLVTAIAVTSLSFSTFRIIECVSNAGQWSYIQIQAQRLDGTHTRLFANRRQKVKRNSANGFWSILLLKDVPSLGGKGEVKQARPGFAFNYLFPRGYAKRATPFNIVADEARRLREAEVAHKQNEQMQDLKQQIEKLCLEIFKSKSNDSQRPDSFWGSLQADEIINLLKDMGYTLQSKPLKADAIKFRYPITTYGLHVVDVGISDRFTAQLKVRVKEK